MAPKGLAILIGAGPATGAGTSSYPKLPCTSLQNANVRHNTTGIARILSSPSHGNLAVALLARRPEPLNELVKSLKSQPTHQDAVLEAFPTDTKPDNLRKAFADIKNHPSFTNLKLDVAIFSIKNSSKKPFLNETFEEFMAPLESYVSLRYFYVMLLSTLCSTTGSFFCLLFTSAWINCSFVDELEVLYTC